MLSYNIQSMDFCDVTQKRSIGLQETVASSYIHRRHNQKFTATGCVNDLYLQKGKILLEIYGRILVLGML